MDRRAKWQECIDNNVNVSRERSSDIMRLRITGMNLSTGTMKCNAIEVIFGFPRISYGLTAGICCKMTEERFTDVVALW